MHADQVQFSMAEVGWMKSMESEATSQVLQQLEALYKTAPVGLALLDRDLRFLRVNQNLADLNGLPVEAHLGRQVSDVLPELAPALEPLLRRVLATGQPIVDIEINGATPNQQSVIRSWIEQFYPVTAKNGTVAAVGVIVREVTERKRAEAALRERTERYELIAAGACDAIWDWDVLNRRVFYSPRWTTLHGFGSNEISDSEEEWSSRIHPEDAPRVLAAVEAHFAGKSAFFKEEYRVRCKDGSWKWVLDRGIAQRDATGRVVRMAGSESDITERKHADEALRMSEARLRRFIDAAPAPIAMFDREMRYIAASRRFRMDYLLEGQELVGRCHYDVFPEIPQHWRDIHQRCLRGAVESSPGERFVRADGTVDWVRWEIQPWYDTHEEIGGIILFTEDITERKEAEESVRLAVAEAARANREKEDFLLAVSHDIRQPLQTLTFLQEVLAKKIQDPEMREVLANQAATVAVMTETLNTLLDIDRLESGAVEPRHTDVALGEVLEHLQDEFEDRARAKLLKTRFVPTSKVVRTDPVLLARILQNLLSNAIKYTKAGGVLMGCRRRGAHVRIEVWDTGIGIPNDETELIFEKYRQGNVEAETSRHGFGLGLSLVRHLCQLLGHEVEVCSAIGKGSVFSISLPLAEHNLRTMEATVPAFNNTPTDGGGIADAAKTESMVYVVDDDPGARAALSKLLEVHSLPVSAYPSAEAFLAAYQPASGRLECLILDVVLSQMTGLELLDILRQRRIDVPTIVVTGQRDMQIAAQAVLLGATDVVEKPLRGEVVVRAVRRAFDAAAQRRASSTKRQELNALFEGLTPRERQVMTMLVSGLANKEVAYRLSISERTIEVHRRAVMQKMKVKSFAELVRVAGILGTGSPPG